MGLSAKRIIEIRERSERWFRFSGRLKVDGRKRVTPASQASFDRFQLLEELDGKSELLRLALAAGELQDELIKKLEEKVKALEKDRDEWQQSAAMACEHPCGNCAGCVLAEETYNEEQKEKEQNVQAGG